MIPWPSKGDFDGSLLYSLTSQRPPQQRLSVSTPFDDSGFEPGGPIWISTVVSHVPSSRVRAACSATSFSGGVDATTETPATTKPDRRTAARARRRPLTSLAPRDRSSDCPA